MTDKHLMVVGGHVSDAENMAGALMLKHKRAGWDVTIVALTAGEKGHPTLPPDEYMHMRMADAKASAEFIGANFEMLPYKDGESEVSMEAIWLMADLIRQYKPTVILTHWRGSMHVDHTNTHHIVHKALFRAALPAFEREHPPHSVKSVLYPENWEDMEEYIPDVYVDVSDVWDDYLKLLNTHALMRDSLSGFRYYDYYNALGAARGALAGYDRAVTLMRPHSLYIYERNPGLLTD